MLWFKLISIDKSDMAEATADFTYWDMTHMVNIEQITFPATFLMNQSSRKKGRAVILT